MNSKKRDRPGQPTKLTPELIERVAQLLPTLQYLESVGDVLGVSRLTWRGWVKRGAKESARLSQPGARPRSRESIYLQFFNTYKKALAQAEADSLERVRQAGMTQWQAAAWLLERRHPQRWSANRRELVRLSAQVAELMRLYGRPPGRAGLPAADPLVLPVKVADANGPAPPPAAAPPVPASDAAGEPWLVSECGHAPATPPPAPPTPGEEDGASAKAPDGPAWHFPAW
jgi:hypothetical protein